MLDYPGRVPGNLPTKHLLPERCQEQTDVVQGELSDTLNNSLPKSASSITCQEQSCRVLSFATRHFFVNHFI